MTTFPNPEVARRRPLAVTVTAWVALLGLVVAAVGAVVLLLPLSTPTQNCGTSAGFLLDGRVNVFVDPEAPPAGITKADALDNNAKPCQERAANRARPAGIAVVGGALIGLLAVLVEATMRWRWRAAARRAFFTRSAPVSDGHDITTR